MAGAEDCNDASEEWRNSPDLKHVAQAKKLDELPEGT